jgi:hypothetical protein
VLPAAQTGALVLGVRPAHIAIAPRVDAEGSHLFRVDGVALALTDSAVRSPTRRTARNDAIAHAGGSAQLIFG